MSVGVAIVGVACGWLGLIVLLMTLGKTFLFFVCVPIEQVSSALPEPLQKIIPSIDQLINQSVNQLINQSINQSVDRSVNSIISRLNVQLLNQ